MRVATRLRLLAAALAWTIAFAAHAQVAAKITHITGTVIETDAAGRSRVLATDSSVVAGARLSTAADSYAHLQFTDGTDLYLRANTEYVVEKYRFEQGKAAEDGFVARLLKGGFRMITGALGRRSPSAVGISANTATIGIRGTDFGVRLCGAPCAAEPGARAMLAFANGPAARVVTLEGAA